jgi:hypothetical protein
MIGYCRRRWFALQQLCERHHLGARRLTRPGGNRYSRILALRSCWRVLQRLCWCWLLRRSGELDMLRCFDVRMRAFRGMDPKRCQWVHADAGRQELVRNFGSTAFVRCRAFVGTSMQIWTRREMPIEVALVGGACKCLWGSDVLVVMLGLVAFWLFDLTRRDRCLGRGLWRNCRARRVLNG